ncbi:DUF4251 domain-containing protein [Flavobacteriaceae bacterium]|nr:DUF4251 domain-containing protein [Flavobacteriaceae bacterium]
MKTNLTYLLIFFLAIQTGFAQKKKQDVSPEFQALIDVVDNQQYQFVPKETSSATGEKFDLTMSRAYFRSTGKEIAVMLPYWGTPQGVTPYNNIDISNVLFKGEPTSYKVKINYKKEKIYVKFSGKQNSEILSFSLTLQPNTTSTLLVTSSVRTSARYKGDLRPFNPSND